MTLSFNIYYLKATLTNHFHIKYDTKFYITPHMAAKL